MLRRLLINGLAALLLSGCVYPMSMVEQGANGGSLYFPSATAGARVFIDWAAAGFVDTELGVNMEPEVGHGTTEVYTRVQA